MGSTSRSHELCKVVSLLLLFLCCYLLLHRFFCVCLGYIETEGHHVVSTSLSLLVGIIRNCPSVPLGQRKGLHWFLIHSVNCLGSDSELRGLQEGEVRLLSSLVLREVKDQVPLVDTCTILACNRLYRYRSQLLSCAHRARDTLHYRGRKPGC